MIATWLSGVLCGFQVGYVVLAVCNVVMVMRWFALSSHVHRLPSHHDVIIAWRGEQIVYVIVTI